MSEERVVEAVSADEVRGHVERITTTIPSRLAGSENGRRMAEYSAAALTEAGVAARCSSSLASLASPSRPAAGGRAGASSRSRRTRSATLRRFPDGLSGELIDVASGALTNTRAGRAGKITLSELSYHPARHEKSASPGSGATGRVMMNWGDQENTAVPFGSVKPAWGNPTPETCKTEMPTLPCVGIARTAGLKLREMLKARPGARLVPRQCRERLAPGADHGRRDQGRTGEFVLVGGHMDSWPGPQATDNAAGNACIMELARVFRQHRDKLRRGLVARLLDGPRDGHDDLLVLVRRPQLGPPARARGRLPADRPAGVRRHVALERRLERRAQALPPGRARRASSAAARSAGDAP